jgi:hypothetical protein
VRQVADNQGSDSIGFAIEHSKRDPPPDSNSILPGASQAGQSAAVADGVLRAAKQWPVMALQREGEVLY